MNRYDGAICNYTLGKNSRKQIKQLLSFNRTVNSNIRSSLIKKQGDFMSDTRFLKTMIRVK